MRRTVARHLAAALAGAGQGICCRTSVEPCGCFLTGAAGARASRAASPRPGHDLAPVPTVALQCPRRPEKGTRPRRRAGELAACLPSNSAISTRPTLEKRFPVITASDVGRSARNRKGAAAASTAGGWGRAACRPGLSRPSPRIPPGRVRWIAAADGHAPHGVHPALDVVIYVLASHDSSPLSRSASRKRGSPYSSPLTISGDIREPCRISVFDN